MSALALVIVETVLADLTGRRGIKQELFKVEEEYPATFQEIKDTLAEKIDAVLASSGVDYK